MTTREHMPRHPAAQCFPMHSEERLRELADDIADNGLIDPIALCDGKVLDGRNRLKACQLAGVEPRFVEHDGDPVAYVRSKNAMRRDLAPDQRRACLIDLEDLDTERRGGDHGNQHTGGKKETVSALPTRDMIAEALGETGRTVQKAITVKKRAPELHEAVKAGKLTHNLASKLVDDDARADILEKIDAGMKPADAVRKARRESMREQLDSVEARTAKALEGVYDVLVIDPPWPMQKIDRDERPNQSGFDYPTMTEAELCALNIPAADDCHVWLWTTQKFLPMALRLLDEWGLRYVCEFVWHKPGGFQPIDLPQYNCEFALYARKGSPKFLDTKAFPTCFNAPRGAHSEKPQEFYDVVTRVTAGRRLDMFNRRLIEGFDGWGNESEAAE